MKEIKNYKEFYDLVYNKKEYITLIYYFCEDDWCVKLNETIETIFDNNNNGNIIPRGLNIKNSELITKVDLTNYPVCRLYKNSKMFQEIYCTHSNMETIISSLLS